MNVNYIRRNVTSHCCTCPKWMEAAARGLWFWTIGIVWHGSTSTTCSRTTCHNTSCLPAQMLHRCGGFGTSELNVATLFNVGGCLNAFRCFFPHQRLAGYETTKSCVLLPQKEMFSGFVISWWFILDVYLKLGGSSSNLHWAGLKPHWQETEPQRPWSWSSRKGFNALQLEPKAKLPGQKTTCLQSVRCPIFPTLSEQAALSSENHPDSSNQLWLGGIKAATDGNRKQNKSQFKESFCCTW